MFDFDAIVFDMDGVILDTERMALKSWVLLADKYGLEGIEEVALKCVGRNTAATTQMLLDTYGEDLDIEGLYKESKELLMKLFEENGGIPLKSGAKELLMWLRDNGHRVGLASSTRYATIVRQLTDAGLIDCFEVIVGGDMVKNSKPLPDIYLTACEKLGVDPKRAMAVEDSKNGIISAHAAGMKTVLVPDLIKPDEEMLEKADLKLSSLDELLEKLVNAGK